MSVISEYERNEAETRRRQAALTWARAHLEQIAWDDLTVRGGWWVDGTGRLWQKITSDLPGDFQHHSSEAYAFTVGPHGWPTWLQAPAGRVRTLQALEAIEAEGRRVSEEREAARRAQLDALPKTTITLAHVRGGVLPTLAAAAALIERGCGSLDVVDGHLQVCCPVVEPFTVQAADVLYTAEAFVVAALKAKRPLPDAPITPAGWPITETETTP